MTVILYHLEKPEKLDLNDLMNAIAVKIPAKWKQVGCHVILPGLPVFAVYLCVLRLAWNLELLREHWMLLR